MTTLSNDIEMNGCFSEFQSVAQRASDSCMDAKRLGLGAIVRQWGSNHRSLETGRPWC